MFNHIMISSCEDLLKYLAERRSVFHTPVTFLHPKQVRHSLKQVFRSYCVHSSVASLHHHSVLFALITSAPKIRTNYSLKGKLPPKGCLRRRRDCKLIITFRKN